MKRLCLMTALFTLASLACSETPLRAQDAPPATAPAEEIGDVRLSAGRPDEYAPMVADLKLEGEQRATLEAKAADRVQRLEAFIAGSDGRKLVELRTQLAAARRAKDEPRAIALREQIKPYSDKYWEIRNSTRRDILGVLTPAQLKQYVGLVLMQRVQRPLARAALSPEQLTQARAICDRHAAAWVTDETIKTDPFFNGLTPIEAQARAQVMASVLTDQQRTLLRQRPTATTAPATPPGE